MNATAPDPEAIEWYWDIDAQRAVRSDERGPADRMLGPYPTRFEAENWKAKSEERNDAWDEADDEWNEGPTEQR